MNAALSMPYPFSSSELTSLPTVLSAPRFQTYLDARGGIIQDALALYQWNAEISAAFLFPIHIFEVCVRNAVANAAESLYGPNWPWVPAFELSLPTYPRPYFSPRHEIQSVRSRHITTGKIIADTKFAFWSFMFTSRHDGRLWQPYLQREFPGLPAGTTIKANRARIHQVAEQVRALRNRIAHHEPVFTRNLADDYAGILEVAGYRCPETTGWMDRTQQVGALLARMP